MQVGVEHPARYNNEGEITDHHGTTGDIPSRGVGTA